MRRTLGFICFILLTISALGQSRIHVDYDKYFTPYRMRLDLVFAGDAAKQEVFLGNISKEVEWSGSKTILADPFEYGEYFLEVIAKNNVVIFSKGFNTLFQEWRTTAEAKEIRKAFNSSYVIPYPQDPVTIRISERRKDTGEFEELASFKVDPNDKLICTKPDNHFKIDTLLYNGECSKKVDLLFVAEGYTKEEMTKFRKDAAKFFLRWSHIRAAKTILTFGQLNLKVRIAAQTFRTLISGKTPQRTPTSTHSEQTDT